jgi:hypothetical protein
MDIVTAAGWTLPGGYRIESRIVQAKAPTAQDCGNEKGRQIAGEGENPQGKGSADKRHGKMQPAGQLHNLSHEDSGNHRTTGLKNCQSC